MISIDQLIFFRLETTKPPELDDGKTMEDPDKGSSLNSTQSIDEPCLKTSKGDEPPHEIPWTHMKSIYIYIYIFDAFPTFQWNPRKSSFRPGPRRQVLTKMLSLPPHPGVMPVEEVGSGGKGKCDRSILYHLYTVHESLTCIPYVCTTRRKKYIYM